MTDEIQEEDDLEAFFEGEKSEEIKTEVEAETIKEESEETEEAPDAPKVDSSQEHAEPTSEKEEKLVPIAALLDVRRKEQQLRKELDELRAKIPKEEELPDPYEDPEAYKQAVREQVRREQALESEKARLEYINRSRDEALQKYADYDEMEQVFELMSIRDKTLPQKMMQSGDPARFAYDTAKKYRDSKLNTDAPQKIEEETIVEVPNLAKATAAAKNTETLEREDDIEDVFADQKY